jgi:hypothetical protein
MSDDNGTPTTSEVAATVTSEVDLTNVITAGSEAAGAAEEVASVEKFKVHKDNPHQVP